MLTQRCGFNQGSQKAQAARAAPRELLQQQRGIPAATKGFPAATWRRHVSTSCRPAGNSSSMNTFRHFSRSFSTF